MTTQKTNHQGIERDIQAAFRNCLSLIVDADRAYQHDQTASLLANANTDGHSYQEEAAAFAETYRQADDQERAASLQILEIPSNSPADVLAKLELANRYGEFEADFERDHDTPDLAIALFVSALRDLRRLMKAPRPIELQSISTANS